MHLYRTEQFLEKLRATFKGLAGLQIPTISAISSMALGGGLELALCTHLRVFGSSSTVGLPETRLAIIPGAGGTYRLPALIGPTRARDLIVPLLALPLLIPVVIASVEATAPLLAQGGAEPLPGRWLITLALYDAVFAAIAYAVFDDLLED